MRDPYTVIRSPLLTEKCYDLKDRHNQVAFKVVTDANKIEVKQAVEKIFKVKVERVNMMNIRGKKKRYGRFQGKRADWKKAVVTLKEGEKIEIIEGVL